MDGIAYFTAEEWLGWINKTARPKIAAFLREKIDAKILKPVPREKDKGEAITLTMAAKNPYHGNDSVYFVFSQIINSDNERREIYGEGYAAIDNLLELHGTKQKHNERGAGRKPTSEDVQRQIKDCIERGMSVRATAKECGVSIATVQKYK